MDFPILFCFQRTSDARKVIVRSFILIRVKIWQVNPEILTKVFCETRVSLWLVGIHLKQKFSLAAAFGPPLVEIHMHQNQWGEKRFVRSGMGWSFAPFEKSNGDKQGTVASGVCKCVLLVPDFRETFAKCFTRKF